MINSRYFILFAMFAILIACNSSNNSEYENVINEWLGKEIKFPKNTQDSKIYKFSQKLKIVTRINGNCYHCLLKLKYWKPFIKELNNKYGIPVFIYLVVSDSSFFNTVNEKEIQFDYPVIIDPENEFLKLNKLPQNSIFHTMLLNHENKIILIGNPIQNHNLQKLYIDQINKLKTK